MKAESLVKKPTQIKIREYLYGRHQSKEPPPSPEEIRRRLGWNMVNEKSR